jgi:hypothetical protein
MAHRLVALLVVLPVAALLVAGCGGDSSPPSASRSSASPPARAEPYTGYPDAIVALGHSGSTGEDSDPQQPGVEVRENSWVTGTNPAVDSLYERILAKHPEIRGHVLALSQGGATVEDVLGQAVTAVSEQPHNALVVVQVMDNDIACPATKADLARFEDTFGTVLSTLDQGLPSSRIFVVTQFGSPDTYAAALTPAQRRAFGGTGPCAFLDPRGRVVPRELDRLESIIQGYEAALRRGCAAVPRCAFDDGAFGDAVDRAEYISTDLNHFSVAGHAAAASIAWHALRREGLVSDP